MLTSHLPVNVCVSSEDDPFLLYASLHSGNHCQFVSRDLMRDHKACMPDSATRQLFFKWQRGHQLVMCNNIAEGQRVQFLVRMKRRIRWERYERRGWRSVLINGVCVFRVFPAMIPLSRLQETRGISPTMTPTTGAPMKYHRDGSASPRCAELTHTF